jgi:LacI family transcriptional regulator
MALTLKQVAKLAGVSRSTASRVINHRPDVRPEVRERVWQVIRQYSYEPNLAARALASHRPDTSTPLSTGIAPGSDSGSDDRRPILRLRSVQVNS